MLRLALALAVSLLLAGCSHKGPIGSIVGGECELAHTPEYAVLGKRPYDQRWVNKTTEGLVVGCKQPRPKPRPASLDAAPRKASVSQPTAADQPIAVPAKARKPRWWQRWRKPKAEG